MKRGLMDPKFEYVSADDHFDPLPFRKRMAGYARQVKAAASKEATKVTTFKRRTA